MLKIQPAPPSAPFPSFIYNLYVLPTDITNFVRLECCFASFLSWFNRMVYCYLNLPFHWYLSGSFSPTNLLYPLPTLDWVLFLLYWLVAILSLGWIQTFSHSSMSQIHNPSMRFVTWRVYGLTDTDGSILMWSHLLSVGKNKFLHSCPRHQLAFYVVEREKVKGFNNLIRISNQFSCSHIRSHL